MSAAIIASGAGLPMPRRFWAVVSITTGSMLYTLDGSITNVALPVIAEHLGIASQTAVLIVSCYNLVLAMLLLPFAAIGERQGHARLFRAGMALYFLASIGCYSANSFGFLLVCRMVQATATAGLLSVSIAMVRLTYPPKMLGRGLGFNTMSSALGSAIAAPLGGMIIAHLAWQTVFIAGLPLALVGLIFSHALPDSAPQDAPYDRKGAMFCAVTFGLLLASLQAWSQGAPATLALTGLLAGIITGFYFVQHERGVTLPVLPVDLLARPSLALSVAGGLFTVLASTVMMLDLPFRLHATGLGSAAIGAMIAPYATTVMIAAPISGMLSDRISAAWLGTLGMIVATAGLIAVQWLPLKPDFSDVTWRVALCGLGFSMFFAPNGRMVASAAPPHRAAGASSLLSTTRMFGQAFGATLFAGLLALKLSAHAPGWLAVALGLCGLLCSAARIVIPDPSEPANPADAAPSAQTAVR